MREWWEPVNPYYDAEFEKKREEEDRKAMIPVIICGIVFIVALFFYSLCI